VGKQEAFHVRQEALLVASSDSSKTGNLAKVLRFFGVALRFSSTAEFLTNENSRSPGKIRLFVSSDTFSEILTTLEDNPERMQWWQNRVHSAFVHAGNNSETLQKLVQRLTGDDRSALHKIKGSVGDITVSHHLDDFCGVMAGVRTTASKSIADGDFVFKTRAENATSIMSVDDGPTFLRLECKGVAVFLSTSSEVIDIDAELTSQNFDIREHFFSVVPLVLYIKWAFAETCWSTSETNACLVIDDPVLKSRHGFVNFRKLLSLMKQHKFSSNIAFIPWNWRRSAPEVARLFRENPENYSVSVHGCDHTRAEFGSSDQRRLYWKAKQALERMNRHETITGIPYDRVMVFPQGIFSEAAISALKHTDLIAAVNNDIISADPHRRAVLLSEMWDVAVMGYSTFPIFTRRYPWEGVENFAFDALLGKPAIIVIHHDYCSDHGERLIDFIDRLNALKCRLIWRSLAEVVSRSCRQRELSSGAVEIEMYAAELRVENHCAEPRRFLIRRRECAPSTIREIHDGSGPTAWNFVDGYVKFEVELSAGESRTIGIRFHELAENGYIGDNLSYRFKAMLRRYLCEVRDNYVTTARFRLAGLAK
jgi:hypothetical protein